MDLNGRIRSSLAWLMIAGCCGLVGFLIVHYYATDIRPVERFAIVIDAGSTQTRSNLFRLTLDAEDLQNFQASDEDDNPNEPHKKTNLGHLFKVQQVSSCVNGGPLASIQGEHDADGLIRGCLNKFAQEIHSLTFTETTTPKADDKLKSNSYSKLDAGTELAKLGTLTGTGIDKQLAIVNHRVNSITHMHLGATAGMRALIQLNSTSADEKLEWIERSIVNSNTMLTGAKPHINPGYIGVLSGSDEASFGWVSANFICEALVASSLNAGANLPEPESVPRSDSSDGLVYQFDTDSTRGPLGMVNDVDNSKDAISIGTLELGGASAQMAFQVDSSIKTAQISNMSLEEQRLTLFNGHYKLAARSDLCLGMSQAVLRANYVLLYKTIVSTIRSNSSPNITLTSACLQRGSELRFTGMELSKLWRSACLLQNDELGAEVAQLDNMVRALATSRDSIRFLGTGDVDQCSILLNELIQPSLCNRYFSLCPNNKPGAPPPKNMPFVTISGYNHALRVLNLAPANSNHEAPFDASSNHWAKLARAIDEKLGGRSISYDQFERQTRDFCSTNVKVLTDHYPRVTRKYQDIICLQLVYIRKLLVEFYKLDPVTSWRQIKFLIFEPKTSRSQTTKSQAWTSREGIDTRPEIGWTLGFLLNVTSHQLDSETRTDIYHHHGASPMYIVRATILLVLACSFMAIALLVVGIIQMRRDDDYHQQTSRRMSRSSSSYDIRGPSYAISYPINYNSIIYPADQFARADHSMSMPPK